MLHDVETCQEYFADEKAVEAAKKKIPDQQTMDLLAGTYQALGEVNRLKILLILGENERCVCELGEVLSMSAPAISHHLRRLKDLGLVKSRRAGKYVYYGLDDEHIQLLLQTGLEHIHHYFKID
jgi:ArsR family transcriptional regulator